MKRYSIVFIVMLSLVGFGMTITHAQTRASAFMDILYQTTEQFPQVAFTVRVQQPDYNTLPALTREQVTIGEAHDPNSVSIGTSEGTLATAFVIDTTAIIPREQTLYREILRYYVTNIHRPGDQLFIIGVTGNKNSAFVNGTNIDTFFDEFSRGIFVNYPNGNQLDKALDAATARLEPLVTTNKTQVIYLHSFVGDTSQEQVRFVHPRIPLYVIRASNFTRNSNLNGLATADVYELVADADTNIPALVQNQLAPLATRLTQNRTLYEVSYLSRQANTGQRTVPITVQTTSGQLSANLVYQRDVVPVGIVLSDRVGNTTSSTITRKAQPNTTVGGEIGTVYSDPSVALVATISYPDNLPRTHLVANLVIDGQVVPVPIYPALDGFNQFQVVWDLSRYETEGTKTYTVSVVVSDEYGQSVTSNTIAYTVVVEAPIVNTVREIIDECADPSSPAYGSAACQIKDNSTVVLGGYVVAGLLVLVMGIGLVTQRQRIAALAPAVGRMSRAVFENTIGRLSNIDYKDTGDVTQVDPTQGSWGGGFGTTDSTHVDMTGYEIDKPTPQYAPTGTQIDGEGDSKMGAVPPFGKNMLARFTVTGVTGLQVIDVPNGVEEFIIGRERPYGCHAIIKEGRVSSRHLILHYHYSKRQFFIENLSKTNGTLLNGMIQLELGQLYPLQNGDTLRLTQREPHIELRFISHHGQMVSSNTTLDVERDVNTDAEFNTVIPATNFPDNSAFNLFIDQLGLEKLDDNRSATQVDTPDSTVEDDTDLHRFLAPDEEDKPASSNQSGDLWDSGWDK